MAILSAGVSGGTVQQDIDSATAGANAVGFTVSAGR